MSGPRWLSDLESLERAATPGPWEGCICTSVIVSPRIYLDDREENDALILALRNRFPQLLRALRAAMEMSAGLKEMPVPSLKVVTAYRAFDAAMQDAAMADDGKKEKK